MALRLPRWAHLSASSITLTASSQTCKRDMRGVQRGLHDGGIAGFLLLAGTLWQFERAHHGFKSGGVVSHSLGQFFAEVFRHYADRLHFGFDFGILLFADGESRNHGHQPRAHRACECSRRTAAGGWCRGG